MPKGITPTKLIETLEAGKHALQGYGTESNVRFTIGDKELSLKEITADLNYGCVSIKLEKVK